MSREREMSKQNNVWKLHGQRKQCATVASSIKTSINFCWGKGFAFNGGDANSNHVCCRQREREPLVYSSFAHDLEKERVFFL